MPKKSTSKNNAKATQSATQKAAKKLAPKSRLPAFIAAAASMASLIILVHSASKNPQEPDPTATIIAIALMSMGIFAAYQVRKQQKIALEAAQKLEQDEANGEVDEEREELADTFYLMDREDEFYTCLENDGPIEDYAATSAAFAKAREQALRAGSKEYIWRKNKDADVCLRCRRNNGRRFNWNVEPKGGHPGCAPGCRCLAEAVMPLHRPGKKSA